MKSPTNLSQHLVDLFPLNVIESDIEELINILAYDNHHTYKLEGMDLEGLRATYELKTKCCPECRHVADDYSLHAELQQWLDTVKAEVVAGLERELEADIQEHIAMVNSNLDNVPKFKTVGFFIGKFFRVSSNSGPSNMAITHSNEMMVLVTDILDTSYPQTVKGLMYTDNNIPMGVTLTMDELVDHYGNIENVHTLEALRAEVTIPLDKELHIMHDMVKIFN